MVATRRGSPLLIGVKTAKKLKVDFVDVEFPSTNVEHNDKCTYFLLSHFLYPFLIDYSSLAPEEQAGLTTSGEQPRVHRSQSRAFM